MAAETRSAGILFISGIPGAGKTTVSRLVAARLPRSARIDGDEIHDLVVSGRLYQADGPSDEVDRQMVLRDRNISMLADNLFEAGFLPVIDDVVVYRPRLERFLSNIKSRPVFLAMLAPDITVAEQRDRDREKHVFQRWSHLDAVMRHDMAGIGYWLDSTGLTALETAAAILEGVWTHGLIAG